VDGGDPVGSLPTPTRADYTFGGWFTLPDGDGEQFDETTTIGGTITLYAKWTPM
jgi:uncharacterized repeat protein (TIGR02543 family)